MPYRWLALAVVGLHFGYLIYLVGGGFLAWRWPRTIVFHLAAVAWAAFVLTTGTPCPVTALQNRLRELGGQHPLPSTFINTYVKGRFYPAQHEELTRAVVALVVVVSWLGYAALRRRAHRGRGLRTG